MAALTVRHGVAYFLAKAGPAAITFATLAAFTQLLNAREYGEFALVSAWVLLFNALLFQWLRLATLRFLPAYHTQRSAFVSTALVSFATLTLTIGVLTALLSIFAPRPSVLWSGALLLVALAANDGALEFARADLRPRLYLFAALIRALGGLAIGVLLIRVGMAGLGAVLGLAFGALLGAVVAMTSVLRDWEITKPDPAILRTLLGYGLPMTLGFSLEFVLGMSDRLLIGWLVGPDAVGEYAVAYDLPRQTLGMLVASMALGALPLAVRSAEKQDWDATRAQLASNATAVAFVGFPAACGLLFVAPNVAFVFFGEEFHAAVARLAPIITIGILLHAVRGYYLDHAFQIAKKPLGHVVVAGSAAVVNVVANMMLLPRHGIVAAAYATVVSYALALVLSLWLGRRLIRMPIPARPLLLVAAASVMMGFSVYPFSELRGAGALLLQVFAGIISYSLWSLLLNVPGTRGAATRLVNRFSVRVRGG